MKNKINYDIQGTLDGKLKARIQTKFAYNLDPAFRGYSIDEFQLHATISSQKEMLEFMKFLENILPCLPNEYNRNLK